MNLLQAKIIVPMALISGLTTSFSSYRYLRQQTNGTANVPVYQEIVVAAQEIAMGTTLSTEHLRLVQWPQSQMPRGSFTDASKAVGRVTRVALLASEPISEQRLAPEGSSGGLSGLIPAGMRALTVSVNPATGVSGFVLPKSRVDVIACIEPGNSKKESTSKTILQDVEVIAVDQKYQTDSDNPVTVQNVTLLVGPADAEKLALATMQGRLLLTLRNTIDDEPSTTSGAKFADLTVAPEPGPVVRYQTVFRKPAVNDELQIKVLPPRKVIEVYRSSVLSEVVFEGSGAKIENGKQLAHKRP